MVLHAPNGGRPTLVLSSVCIVYDRAYTQCLKQHLPRYICMQTKNNTQRKIYLSFLISAMVGPGRLACLISVMVRRAGMECRTSKAALFLL